MAWPRGVLIDGRGLNVSDEPNLSQLESLLGHEFSDRDLLLKALTHASLVEERLESNERLEFLGDVVLGLVVCQFLFEEYGDYLEGELTKIKSSVVSRKVCAEIVREQNLHVFLRLGKGLSTRGTIPESVLAAVYEALIGALYLDAGLEPARDFILSDMREKILTAARTGHQYNFKSVLQQAAQQEFDMTPQYLLLDEQGPDHCKCFEICVTGGLGDERP